MKPDGLRHKPVSHREVRGIKSEAVQIPADPNSSPRAAAAEEAAWKYELNKISKQAQVDREEDKELKQVKERH